MSEAINDNALKLEKSSFCSLKLLKIHNESHKKEKSKLKTL